MAVFLWSGRNRWRGDWSLCKRYGLEKMTKEAKPSVFRRNNCRLCGGKSLEQVLRLTPSPPVDAYVPAGRLKEFQESFPLDLFLCHSCGHVQLLDVVNPELLFGNYIYETSSSPGLVEHFRKYADAILTTFHPAPGSLVVDIGSNDGTLLNFFKNQGFRVLGVDPAREMAQKAIESGIETLDGFFTNNMARQIRNEHGPAAIVTANNVFAHADDLSDMADGVRTLLAPDGCFVFEVSYLLDMIQGMVFDFIYHEHLCYHSVKPLVSFLGQHGMVLIDAQRIPTKGGSLRCITQPAEASRSQSLTIAQMLELEASIGLDRPEIFKSFAVKIESVKNQLVRLLSDLKGKGETFAGYGASATVTVLLYHFGLRDFITFLVDDNPLRQNLFSPGYHIPVLSPDAIYKKKPDYVVILAWRFAQPIISKHQAFLKQGGHFIIPLLKLKVL